MTSEHTPLTDEQLWLVALHGSYPEAPACNATNRRVFPEAKDLARDLREARRLLRALRDDAPEAKYKAMDYLDACEGGVKHEE